MRWYASRMIDVDLLREAEIRLEQAQLNSEGDVLDVLLHPQVTYVGPDGGLVTKEADLDAHRSGDLRIYTLDRQALDVRIQDGVGITVLTAWLEGQSGDQAFGARMRYTRVWAPGPQGWRVVAAHASTLPS